MAVEETRSEYSEKITDLLQGSNTGFSTRWGNYVDINDTKFT